MARNSHYCCPHFSGEKMDSPRSSWEFRLGLLDSRIHVRAVVLITSQYARNRHSRVNPLHHFYWLLGILFSVSCAHCPPPEWIEWVVKNEALVTVVTVQEGDTFLLRLLSAVDLSGWVLSSFQKSVCLSQLFWNQSLRPG